MYIPICWWAIFGWPTRVTLVQFWMPQILHQHMLSQKPPTPNKVPAGWEFYTGDYRGTSKILISEFGNRPATSPQQKDVFKGFVIRPGVVSRNTSFVSFLWKNSAVFIGIYGYPPQCHAPQEIWFYEIMINHHESLNKAGYFLDNRGIVGVAILRFPMMFGDVHLSHEKNSSYFPLNPGCFSRDP